MLRLKQHQRYLFHLISTLLKWCHPTESNAPVCQPLRINPRSFIPPQIILPSAGKRKPSTHRLFALIHIFLDCHNSKSHCFTFRRDKSSLAALHLQRTVINASQWPLSWSRLPDHWSDPETNQKSLKALQNDSLWLADYCIFTISSGDVSQSAFLKHVM